jgi:hypothetical protein
MCDSMYMAGKNLLEVEAAGGQTTKCLEGTVWGRLATSLGLMCRARDIFAADQSRIQDWSRGISAHARYTDGTVGEVEQGQIWSAL